MLTSSWIPHCDSDITIFAGRAQNVPRVGIVVRSRWSSGKSAWLGVWFYAASQLGESWPRLQESSVELSILSQETGHAQVVDEAVEEESGAEGVAEAEARKKAEAEARQEEEEAEARAQAEAEEKASPSKDMQEV